MLKLQRLKPRLKVSPDLRILIQSPAPRNKNRFNKNYNNNNNNYYPAVIILILTCPFNYIHENKIISQSKETDDDNIYLF
jgi:hypothetical protein